MPTLSPDRWQQISPYLDQALSLPESERSAWVESFRAEKPELAELLQELLEEHSALAQKGFLERSPIPDTSQSSLPGQKIGAYTLISPIGEGGMGSVWLAERSDGRFERQVALKFLRFSIASAGGAERFRREGRILGQLAHPHIAELIDAGVTSNGEPYLVLEHVEGENIDEYCDKRSLDVDARIRLFLDVVSAVALAHANLIVHRDLKPSNVLVRNDRQVKLLDFGIAKLLTGEGTVAATLLTQEGGGALTPQYAAPEQVTGGAITTATDVYTLGVLLYLLLTGQHPAGAGPHSPADLVKAIVETEPPRASDAATATEAKVVAVTRGTTAEKLRRQLRGDLDTIIGKALKKNPAERYTSVTALADDLQRYLKHEPIGARPDSFTYRTTKFVRRNGLAVALTAVAFLAVVAGVTGTVMQARTARQQRDTAIRERDRANRITEFMTKIFKVSDPSEARGNSVTAREILDKTSHEIDSGLEKDAETQAQMMSVMGTVYYNLGLFPQAEKLQTRALDIRRRVLGPEHPDTLRSMTDVGKILAVLGHKEEAQKMLADALSLDRRVLGNEHPETLRCMNTFAYLLTVQDRIAEAGNLYRQAMELRRRVLGPEHPDTLATMGNLAYILVVQHRYDEAEKLQREALAAELRVLGADDVETTVSENMLARILSLEHKYPEAEKIQRQALESQRRILGVEHMFTMRSLNNFADILYNEGHYADSEALFVEIRDVQRRTLSPDNPATAVSTYSIGSLEALQGHRTQALSQIREAIDHGLQASVVLAIDKDDDLKSLHGDPRFKALVAYAKKHAGSRQKAN
jgi:serine/threonine protein kinase